ncbi:MAG: hypothetical protein KGN34_15830 [Sphingomonadales bacterium]|nr:hypothetical protein [Sphingomonadales bacterium]
MIVVLTVAIALERMAAIPVALTLRVVVAAACLFFMSKIGAEYPGQKWPVIAIAIAATINVATLCTPLATLPTSKGDVMFFAAPDAVIFLAARTFTYPATDPHQRAVRQQLILALILALAFCAILLSSFVTVQRIPTR